MDDATLALLNVFWLGGRAADAAPMRIYRWLPHALPAERSHWCVASHCSSRNPHPEAFPQPRNSSLRRTGQLRRATLGAQLAEIFFLPPTLTPHTTRGWTAAFGRPLRSESDTLLSTDVMAKGSVGLPSGFWLATRCQPLLAHRSDPSACLAKAAALRNTTAPTYICGMR